MHVIINILFYCKLRNIYGLKWTTTSKRSSPPRGREWKICLNMKVVKWVAAHTGMFIKRSVKTGKTRDWLTRFCCHWCWINLDRVWLFLFSWTRFSGPPPNQRDVHCLCRSSRAYISLHAAVHVFMCSWVQEFLCFDVQQFMCSEIQQEFRCSVRARFSWFVQKSTFSWSRSSLMHVCVCRSLYSMCMCVGAQMFISVSVHSCISCAGVTCVFAGVTRWTRTRDYTS